MNVLKDASAAAIYGVRAANGVILITTRKGSQGNVQISYDGYVGVQTPVNIMPLANKDQYVELLNEANKNITGYVPKNPGNYPVSADWYNELVRNALMHNHSLDISGATEKTNYSLGANYFYQEGIMTGKNDYERFNFRLRLDQEVTHWLKAGGSAVISNYTKNSPNTETVFASAFVSPPVYPVYDDTNEDAYPVRFGSPQDYGFSNTYGNPYAAAYYHNNKEDGLKLIFSTFAELTFIPEKLTFKTAYNLNYNDWKSRAYTPEHHVGGSQGVRQSDLSKTFGISSKQIIDNVLTYTGAIDRHDFSIMLGQSTRIENESTLTGSATGVPGYDDSSIYITNGSSRDRSASDGAYRYRGLSYFMRGTYNYDDRYLATLTFRADGTSKYNDHWGYFPSAGLGWILTGEDFMKNQTIFDYLKLRASWGLLGNDNVPSNSSHILGTTGAESSGIFGDQLVNGQGAQTVYQNHLKWEVVNEFNVGFDSRFLNQRLSAELDFYNRTTYHVVFYVPIPAGAGKIDLLANNGTVRNRGIELSLNWNDKINNNWGYSIGLNASTISNKVLALEDRDYIPGALIRGNYATMTKVGEPIGSFWGYEVDGVYASEAEALKDPVSQTIKDAGYFRYKDQNGDKIIDDKDKVNLGSPIPWLMGGINAGLNYKNFDVGLNIQGQFGNKILNAKRMTRDIFADGNYDLDFYQNAWRPGNKSTVYPSPEAYNSAFIQQANSFFVEDASYIRIQNIQAGYTFHKLWRLSKVRIYIAAQRPFTYFTYNGFTPEVSGTPIENGIDKSVYPMQAVYTCGLKINL
jgi:TonB-linked SusC/RagA family outer membrane protein